MSRINDALKRVQQAQQREQPSPRTDAPRLTPVACGTSSVIGWILPGVIGVLIVAASLFIGMAIATHTATKAANKPKLLAARSVNPAPAPAPTPALPKPSPPPLPQIRLPSPPETPPEPKLQGIVYAATEPWAIVDGRTVHVGDQFGEFRVKAISPRSVTLEKADGSQKKLGLDN